MGGGYPLIHFFLLSIYFEQIDWSSRLMHTDQSVIILYPYTDNEDDIIFNQNSQTFHKTQYSKVWDAEVQLEFIPVSRHKLEDV